MGQLPRDAASQQFPLLSATRFVAPLVVTLGLTGVLFASGALARVIYAAGSALILGLWALARARRPVLVVDGEGYQVEVRGEVRFRVRFADVLRVRASPSEQAMYLDAGDPAHNLLLPRPSGFGFGFARQDALYALLCERLDGKIEIVAQLSPDTTGPTTPVPEGSKR